jgi:adenine-specific DNA-methyltransferase
LTIKDKKKIKIKMKDLKERRQKLGQYFTVSEILQEKVYEFILNKPIRILEPSVGRGDLVEYIKKRNNEIVFDMYEIDKELDVLSSIKKEDIIYEDFLTSTIKYKYETIIGNPPYVKQKKGNMYLEFINKCFDILVDKGELIFIVPSTLFHLTGAKKILDKMMKMGCFTHIYHPHNENLFEEAFIDIMIFRYCKNSTLEKKIMYNGNSKYIDNNEGSITITDEEKKGDGFYIKEYFDVYVGIVSGKEEVFKNKGIGNIQVLTAENKIESYIYITKYPCGDKKIDTYLKNKKDILMERRIKKITEENWFEWGAPRNIKKMEEFKDMDCIYVYNLTRKSKIAFKGKMNYFGGNLMVMKPKKQCNLDKIVEYLNSEEFKKRFEFSGRFKMSHNVLSNTYISNIM